MAEDQSFEEMIDGLDAHIHSLTAVALAKGMEHVSGVSAELVPVETGHLVGSRDLTVVGDEAHLTFPGPYARYQHYELQLRHTHGQALYLEQPMITEVEKVMKIMGDVFGAAF